MCDIADKEARFCYHDDNEKRCCESCKRHRTGVKGCEFGDRLPDCNQRRCPDYNYAVQCCKTCAQTKEKVTSLVPASPTPSQSVVFFVDHTHVKGDSSVTTLSENVPSSVLPTLSSPLRHNRRNQDNTLIVQRELEVDSDADIPVSALSQNIGTMKPLVEMQVAHNAKQFKSQGPLIPQSKVDSKVRPTLRPNTKPSTRTTEPFRRSSTSTSQGKRKQKFKKQQKIQRRQQPSVKSRNRNRRLNIKPSPKYNQRKKSNTSRHSRLMTTTFRTKTNLHPAKRIKNKFTYPTKKCVKPEATFMSLKCRWLVRLMKGLCSNALLGSICCKPCTPSKKKEFVCKDQQGCIAKTGAHCYNDIVRYKCCATCKRFETGYADCRYGDRESHCSLFMHYMPAYTCGAFKQKCCMSCQSNTAPITTITPRVFRNEVHPSKPFQDRKSLFRSTRHHRQW
ncbi:uncharacterized protein LOC117336876 [Pecten maximus]|uniref:uncharacterized protein LOC117336876 n=1 Tax=Pecten maximus TaxID=6579 RepID=UPI0014589EDF|nr:uncharacterized protein LOC117336876 [Pecten maximus]